MDDTAKIALNVDSAILGPGIPPVSSSRKSTFFYALMDQHIHLWKREMWRGIEIGLKEVLLANRTSGAYFIRKYVDLEA